MLLAGWKKGEEGVGETKGVMYQSAEKRTAVTGQGGMQSYVLSDTSE